jgi:hypothetical protein
VKAARGGVPGWLLAAALIAALGVGWLGRERIAAFVAGAWHVIFAVQTA